MKNKNYMKETMEKEAVNNIYTTEVKEDAKVLNDNDMDLIGDLYFILWDEYKFQTKRKSKRSKYNYEGIFAQDPKEIRRKLSVLYEMMYKSDRGINIFEQKEVKVIFNGKEGYSNFNSNEAANKCLIKDMVYTLKDIVPYEEFATVELVEYPEYKYCASSFCSEEKSRRSKGELLEEYGISLYEDLNKRSGLINKLNKGDKKMKIEIEELYDFYEEIKDEKYIDVLDDMVTYITDEECMVEFNIGDSFNDGKKRFTVLFMANVEDKHDDSRYFCKIEVEGKNLVWYYSFNQREMEIIRSLDLGIDENSLTEKRQLVNKIIRATGGVMWSFIQPDTEEQISTENAPMHKYNVGDVIEAEDGRVEILYVSPTIDGENCWIYFTKNYRMGAEGDKKAWYGIMVEM